jgi:hypothetical protein
MEKKSKTGELEKKISGLERKVKALRSKRDISASSIP